MLQRQRLLSDRQEHLQCRAGELFTLADIDVSLAVAGGEAETREQPSARELMAYITVLVVTSLELSAQAWCGPRLPLLRAEELRRQ